MFQSEDWSTGAILRFPGEVALQRFEFFDNCIQRGKEVVESKKTEKVEEVVVEQIRSPRAQVRGKVAYFERRTRFPPPQPQGFGGGWKKS